MIVTFFTFRVPIWMKKTSGKVQEDNPPKPDESRVLRPSRDVNYQEHSSQEHSSTESNLSQNENL